MAQKAPQPKTPKEHISNARAELKQYFSHREEIDMGANKGEKVKSADELAQKLSERSRLGYNIQDTVRAFIINRGGILGLDSSAKLNDYVNRVREPMAMAMLDELEKGLQ